MKTLLILSLFLGLATANCIFDTNLGRPICLNSNGSRITWNEYAPLPLEIKYQMQTEILNGISNDVYVVPNLNASEAKEIIKKFNYTAPTTPVLMVHIPNVGDFPANETPIINNTTKLPDYSKNCEKERIRDWDSWCWNNPHIDCKNANAETKKMILDNMRTLPNTNQGRCYVG